jgi:poly-gamma-glutamate synthesis protein (capsule biosynthesis protein)
VAALAAVGVFIARPALSTPPVLKAAAHAPLSPLVDDTTAFTAPALLAVVQAGRPATLTISAVGDMIFDRQVKALVVSSGGSAPLAAVASHLSQADVTIGNLESPLSTGGVMNATKDVTFRGDPRGVEGLVASGFDFLSIANNHVLDYGPDALADTVATLDARGIAHAGAGANRAAAWKPAVIERDGTSIAYLAFSHILPPGFVATDSKAGLAAGRNNMDAVTTAIRSAKGKYDYVIVSFHWGVEYQDDANGEQVRDARAAVDAGADMVLAHHPHVIQAVEYYKNRLIAYSLGDFVFDHYSRKTGEAFVLDAALGPDGVTDVKVTPVYLDGHGKPEFVTGSEATVILDRLKAISAKRSTLVSIDGNTATVTP